MYSTTYHATYQRWRGGNFAPITIAKLKAIPSTVVVTQGGLSFAPASAMTHAGIGAFDLNTDGRTKAQVWDQCRELMAVDIIPCPRGFTWDSFQGATLGNTNDGNEHLHCLDRDCYATMHPEAQAQVREILAGGDGLVGSAPYFGPPLKLTPWRQSPYNPNSPANIQKRELDLPTTAEVARDLAKDRGFLNAVAAAVWAYGIPSPGKDRKKWAGDHLVDWLARVAGGNHAQIVDLQRQVGGLTDQIAALAQQTKALTTVVNQKGSAK